jgi:2-aminoethylphosphonate-pyruvate transaminase
MERKALNPWKDKVLYTPGPLTTSKAVKEAMLRDVGSRDEEFTQIIADVRNTLLEIAGVAGKGYEAVLLQGSGTYAVEAVISTATPPDGKWLVIVNGAYGERICKIADILRIKYVKLKYPENNLPVLGEISQALADDSEITHVAVIHHETTTGLINPIDDIGEIVKKFGKIFFVDAMSSFGALPIDMHKAGIDYLACTANKNIESVPGIAFVLAKRDVLLTTKGWARSLTLDILDQLMGFEKNGQFRFTPPTHAILAFKEALLELEEEGGIVFRAARYRENYETLVAGMRKMGFTEYLPEEMQGIIIVSFNYPNHKNFEFGEFYERLNQRGYVIYPGKVSNADCFRIGVCGRLFKSDILDLLNTIKEVLAEMKIEL